MSREPWGWRSLDEFMAAVCDTRGAVWIVNDTVEQDLMQIKPGVASPARLERASMTRAQLLDLVDALERQIAELEEERACRAGAPTS